MNRNILFFLLFTLFSLNGVCQNKEKTASSPTFKMSGSALLTSHHISHGLSQTQSDPALQVQFAYNLGPQIEFGLWGSNVRFPQSDEHLNLHFFGKAMVQFTANTQLDLDYRLSRYFHNDRRNGSILQLQFNMFEYYVLLSSNSNWEGSSSSSSHFGFGHKYNFSTLFNLETQFSYNQLSATGYNNFFDILVEANYISNDTIKYAAGLTLNSESSQFRGAGDPFLYARIKTTF